MLKISLLKISLLKISLLKISSFKMSSKVNNNLSIFIPRVFPNITTQEISKVFESYMFGIVDHIDLVPKIHLESGFQYNSAYIHFKKWNNSPMVSKFHERIMNYSNNIGQDPPKIIYSYPFHWVILENKSSKKIQRKIKVNLSDEQPKPYEETNNPCSDLLSLIKQNPMQKNTCTTNINGALIISALNSDIQMDTEEASNNSEMETSLVVEEVVSVVVDPESEKDLEKAPEKEMIEKADKMEVEQLPVVY